jgi:predicted nucleotidyltransferase
MLDARERDCLRRYCELLAERLGDELVRVTMFGSAARGDMWPPGSPMHSDIDLLVLTEHDVPETRQEELINATYPLFLECGRQLSPHFFRARTVEFLVRVAEEGVDVWPR